MARYFMRGGTAEPQPVSLTYYDAEGRRVETLGLTDGRPDLRKTFTPFMCHDAPAGPCSHVFTSFRVQESVRKANQQRDYEIEGRGKTERIFRVTPTRRSESICYTRDARGIITLWDEEFDTPKVLLAERAPG